MQQIAARNETAYEFLLKKGIHKVHQPQKRYNLSIAELVEFLNEFAENAINNYEAIVYGEEHSDFHYRTNSDYAV
jgi:hypothetical protein